MAAKLTIPGVTIDSNVTAGHRCRQHRYRLLQLLLIPQLANCKAFSFTWNGSGQMVRTAVKTDNDTIQSLLLLQRMRLRDSFPPKLSHFHSIQKTDASAAAPSACLLVLFTWHY